MIRTDGRIIMPPLDDPWEAGTFEGAEYETLRRGAAMTFLERLQWIEQCSALGAMFAEARRHQPAAADRGADF